MTNLDPRRRAHIEDLLMHLHDDMYDVVLYTRAHLKTMHPGELERCLETLDALSAEELHLNAQWDIAVFGEER